MVSLKTPNGFNVEVPESHEFFQFHSRKMKLPTDDLGNSVIYRPKDQPKFKNRIVLNVDSKFPATFYWLKNKTIKFLIKRNS